jgi:UDP-N-acetyl-L-fucosamine synthase
MEQRAAMMTGFSPERIDQALGVLARQGRGAHRTIQTVGDYAATHVSEKVVRIILSYTDYLRRTVWGIPALD